MIFKNNASILVILIATVCMTSVYAEEEASAEVEEVEEAEMEEAETHGTCAHRDRRCIARKGRCMTGNVSCPRNWYQEDSWCGVGEECYCCYPQCYKDRRCLNKPNGRCVAGPELCPDHMIFTQHLCQRSWAQESATCGCCYANCLTHSTACSQKRGHCVRSQSECQLGWRFDSQLCKVDPTTGVTNCGCCYPPSFEACRTTDTQCSAKRGRCMPNSNDCPVHLGWVFESTWCGTSPDHDHDTPCGCCYNPKAFCRPNDERCHAIGGHCVNPGDAACPFGHRRVQEYCGFSQECYCCVPPNGS